MEKVSGLELRPRIGLAFLAVATLAYHLTEQNLEIAESLIDLFNQYEKRIPELEDEKAREFLTGMAELCIRRIAFNLCKSRDAELDSFVDPYNLAVRVLAQVPRGASVWFEARNQVAAVAQVCRNTKAEMRPWLRRLDHADVRDLVFALVERCTEIEIKAENVLGS